MQRCTTHTLREREVQTATGSSSNLQTESYTGYLLQTESVKERERGSCRQIERLTETGRNRYRGRDT